MKKSIRDLKDIKGKRALVRVDMNVPLDENKNVTIDSNVYKLVETYVGTTNKGKLSEVSILHDEGEHEVTFYYKQTINVKIIKVCKGIGNSIKKETVMDSTAFDLPLSNLQSF